MDLQYLSILDEHGTLDEGLEPALPADDLRRLYETMVLVRAYDDARLRLQRQGRIGTFAPVKGQEAAQLGSAYALRPTDWVVPSFRETAVMVWRGACLEDDLLYCAGREEGLRFTEESRDLPIAIPVASQLPHAVGLAWARKLQGQAEAVLAYFGDGATSEGDFHEALNFAAVYQTPVVFFCQNNGWAISVPRSQQTHSRTLAQKAFAYDIPTVQVDGNDLLAVYAATSAALDRARGGGGPSFIEAITYRLGVHTTADDPTKYRRPEELAAWERRDPIPRFRDYLRRKGLLDEVGDERARTEAEDRVRDAVARFEELQRDLDPLAMFDYAYAERPPYLERQRQKAADHLAATGKAGPGEEVPPGERRETRRMER